MWTPPLIAALRGRHSPPFIRRSGEFELLYAAAEQPWPIYLGHSSPAERARLLEADGLDHAVIALSSPLGIEALPRQQALELIDAHLAGIEGLPGPFSGWGPVALDGLEAADVDAALARGCVGVSLPAGALADPERVEHAGPVLERAAAAGAPVFVHPGRAPGQPAEAAPQHEPNWWRALSDYISQMQAAWLAFASSGRSQHPDLVVVFAMLAGGAPLLAERLHSRGGPQIDLQDPLTYYDTSSYGAMAIEAIGRIVGRGQLVYGSDRPVIDPIPSARDAALQTRAGQVLAAELVSAG